MSTNAIAVLNQAASSINWTLIISLFGLLTAITVGIVTAISKKKSINDDDLRESALITDLISSKKDNSERHEDLTEIINNLKIEIEKIKVELANKDRYSEDLVKNNKELLQKLDELLRQLLDVL